MNKRVILILCFVFGWVELSQAQLFNRLRFEQITTRDGLSQSTINDILQDRRGFLWIATDDGLNRYDGYEFKVFRNDPFSGNTLPSSQINDIMEDWRGNIWSATNGGGLSKYDRVRGRFTNYRHDPNNENSLSSDFVTSIHADSRTGTVIIGTNEGLNLLDPETGVIRRFDSEEFKGLRDSRITTLFEDEDRFIWIGTQDAGLYRLDREDDTFVNYQHDPKNNKSISDNWVTKLYNDKRGQIWVGTQSGGLNLFDKVDEEFTRFRSSKDPSSISNDWVLSMFEDQLGTFWVGTLDGLNILDRETGKFTQFDNLDYPINLSNNTIISLFEDRSGVLWVGTREGALNKFVYSTESFFVYQADEGSQFSLNDNIVWSVVESGNSLWVGTQGGGLNHIDRETGTPTYYTHNPSIPNSISDNYVNKVFEDSKGNIWVGTINGLDLLVDKENGFFKHYRHNPDDESSISGNIVTTIFEDSKDILWVGTLNNGLNAFDRETETFTRFQSKSNDPNSISHNKIWSMYEDRRGNFWVGTNGYGLNKYDRVRERFNSYVHDAENPSSISNNFVNFIHQDKKDNLWIGTLNGLNKFDPNTEEFTTYTVKNGLPNNVMYGIVEDSRGHLWVSTNRGIVDFNPDPILDDQTGDERLEVKVYDAGDGLPSNEYRFGSYHKGESGIIYFGGINGLVAFAPDSVQDNPYRPPVVLTDFLLFNEVVPIGGVGSPLLQSPEETSEIVLRADQDVFSFEFAGLHFAAPDENQYAYMLEGYDDGWNYSGSRRETQYTNLPQGDYVFKVIAANKDGVWNSESEGILIKVKVLPPLWKTWWAYTIYGMLLFGGVIGFINFQVSTERKKKEKAIEDKERLEKLVNERTAELEIEKEKSDQLLYNMLPRDVADEIKAVGQASPRRFDETTVLFSDFKNFTPTASTMSATMLVNELNTIFEKFDELTAKHGLEKIKTIGDAYMAVSGLPHEHKDHAVNAARCAIEMQEYISERNKTASVKWNMRLGLHSGSVIAGVVGKNKFTYDLWGNTVNLASRMESSGVEDKVNVSAATFELIRDEFEGEYRGKIEVDGKGDVDMYLIKPKNKEAKKADSKAKTINGSRIRLDTELMEDSEAEDGKNTSSE